ncbi:MAG: type II toxin-antitoxin system Phd/YefM family antitoxin [Opitutales bacterium]
MEASIVDLRYKSKEVLRALDRNEEVRVTYRGKVKGRIISESESGGSMKVVDHPFFGIDMDEASEASVESIMDDLRKPRY